MVETSVSKPKVGRPIGSSIFWTAIACRIATWTSRSARCSGLDSKMLTAAAGRVTVIDGLYGSLRSLSRF
jgi:hypothetical protein